MACDFCSARDAPVFYNTAPATLVLGGSQDLPIVELRSNERWSCCLECATIIESGDRYALAQRSVETFPIPGIVELNTALFIQGALFWDVLQKGRMH